MNPSGERIEPKQTAYLYTGGYTLSTKLGSGETVEPGCPGILCFAWDEDQGSLRRLHVTKEGAQNPTWITIDAQGGILYAVNELKQLSDADGGAAAAYRIHPENGALTYLGRQAAAGKDPCHLALAPGKRHLLCANFSGGSFGVFPIREDGSLEAMSCLLRHSGAGPNPDRQEMPHPHQVLRAPGPEGESCFYICDLGLDQMICYELDPERGWLCPSKRPPVCGTPGQGMRHGIFSADGTRLYVVTEMSCEVNVYRYEPSGGANELLQVVSAMGEEKSANGAECLGAEIHIHPGGKWLYASIRRSNHIAVFDIDENGLLTLKQTIGSGGAIPRDFVLSPGGNWLLAGNQDSGTIRIFRIHPETGMLTVKEDYDQAEGATVLAFF